MYSRIVGTLDAVPWAAVDALRYPWLKYESALAPRLSSQAQHHLLLDSLVANLKANSVFHPYKFYDNGFGQHSVLPSIASQLSHMTSHPIPALRDLTLRASRLHGRKNAIVIDGTFTSPGDHALLPGPSHQAAFQLVIPRSWSGSSIAAIRDNSAASNAIQQEMARLRPIAVLLPGTGEQGFRRRRHCVAYPLANLGISTLILEGPFYGSRRPSEQAASKLKHYTDLIVLGKSTIEETRALVGWLKGYVKASELSSASSTNLQSANNGYSGIRETGDQFLSTGISDGNVTSRIDTSRLEMTDEQISTMANAAAASANSYSLKGPLSIVSKLPLVASLLNGKSGPAADAASEAASVIEALQSQSFGFGPVVLAGTSMGGLHSAMTACHLPPQLAEQTGVASWLGPPTAAPVFTLGALSAGVDWRSLAAQADLTTEQGQALEASLTAMERQLSDPVWDHASDVATDEMTSTGAEALARLAYRASSKPDGQMKDRTTTLAAVSHARRQMARLSRITDLTNHPPPIRSDAAIFTIAQHDLYIPRTRCVDGMWRHVLGRAPEDAASSGSSSTGSWRGCSVRPIRGGHVSASIFSIDTACGAIVEVIRRLQAR